MGPGKRNYYELPVVYPEKDSGRNCLEIRMTETRIEADGRWVIKERA